MMRIRMTFLTVLLALATSGCGKSDDTVKITPEREAEQKKVEQKVDEGERQWQQAQPQPK